MQYSSNSRSYYEDYARKRGTAKLISDPPSLLTDRGAYVNFLEIQLERVTSACFAMQSYEQKMNDMQLLLTNFDEKLSTTTRLVGLAQQCTEEVRRESLDRIESLSKLTQIQHQDTMSMMKALSDRMTSIESNMNNTFQNVMSPRIDKLELLSEDFASVSDLNVANTKIAQLETIQKNDRIEIQSKLIEQSNQIHDTESRTHHSISQVETKLLLSIENDKREIENKLNTSAIDNLNASLEQETERLHQLEQIKDMYRDIEQKSIHQFSFVDKEISAIHEILKMNNQYVETVVNQIENDRHGFNELKSQMLHYRISNDNSAVQEDLEKTKKTAEIKLQKSLLKLKKSLKKSLDEGTIKRARTPSPFSEFTYSSNNKYPIYTSNNIASQADISSNKKTQSDNQLRKLFKDFVENYNMDQVNILNKLNQLKIPATESKSYNSSRSSSRSPQRVTSSIPVSSNIRVEVPRSENYHKNQISNEVKGNARASKETLTSLYNRLLSPHFSRVPANLRPSWKPTRSNSPTLLSSKPKNFENLRSSRNIQPFNSINQTGLCPVCGKTAWLNSNSGVRRCKNFQCDHLKGAAAIVVSNH